MFPKIILISGAPGIQRWKVAAKIQQWQVSYFSIFKPKPRKDINNLLVLRNCSEASRRIHTVQSWTFKRWAFNKIQRSTAVRQMRWHFKLSQGNLKSHFLKLLQKKVLYSSKRWMPGGDLRAAAAVAMWLATLGADPATDHHGPSKSLSRLAFVFLPSAPTSQRNHETKTPPCFSSI